MDKAINDKIEIIKRQVGFFSQPLLCIDHEFNFIPIEIDKKFLFFESYFYDSFRANVEKKYAIGKFEEFLYNQIGYSYFATSTDGGEQIYRFHWSELVVYSIEGDYYDNTYFANHRKDPIGEEYLDGGHVKDGFDEKTKAKVMELLDTLKLKFKNLRERIDQEILGDLNKNDQKPSLGNKKIENNQAYDNDFKSIINSFNALDANLRWNYAFRSEDDMYLITDLFARYFNQLPYEIPSNIIQNQKGSKTRLSSTIKEIYELDKKINISKKSDLKFIEILKILSVYQNLDDNRIYNAITK